MEEGRSFGYVNILGGSKVFDPKLRPLEELNWLKDYVLKVKRGEKTGWVAVRTQVFHPFYDVDEPLSESESYEAALKLCRSYLQRCDIYLSGIGDSRRKAHFHLTLVDVADPIGLHFPPGVPWDRSIYTRAAGCLRLPWSLKQGQEFGSGYRYSRTVYPDGGVDKEELSIIEEIFRGNPRIPGESDCKSSKRAIRGPLDSSQWCPLKGGFHRRARLTWVYYGGFGVLCCAKCGPVMRNQNREIRLGASVLLQK
ncbi:MAG TPA: hypothetical protein VJ327_03335 [Patescibacteria group bacterium]|nr:hypothetical protein [Patescibacteria group bacterium]